MVEQASHPRRPRIQDLGRVYLIKNTAIISVCQGLAMVSAFVLDALTVATFGLGDETDAYFAALALPATLASIIQSQGPAVLVPAFSAAIEESAGRLPSPLLSNLLNTSALLLSGVALLGMLGSKLFVPLQVPGLATTAVPLATGLSRLLFWLVVPRGLSCILTAVLYSRHQYLLPSSLKLLSNLVAIVLVCSMYRDLGIYALGIGLILGSLVELLLSIAATLHGGFHYSLLCRFSDSGLHKILSRLVYPFAGEGMVGARVVLENYLASYLPAGSVSVLRYASRIVETISTVLVGGVVTTTLPLISYHAMRRDYRALKLAVVRSIKLLLFISLPVGLWLIMVRVPLISLFLERGRFTEADVTRTASLLALLAPYVFVSRISAILQLPFYAAADTKTPLLGTVTSLVVSGSVALLLVDAWGIYTFPIATCIGASLSAVVLYSLMARTLGHFHWSQYRTFCLRLGAAMAVMLLVLSAGVAVTGRLASASPSSVKVLAFALPTVMGIAAFGAMSLLTGLLQLASLRHFATSP